MLPHRVPPPNNSQGAEVQLFDTIADVTGCDNCKLPVNSYYGVPRVIGLHDCILVVFNYDSVVFGGLLVTNPLYTVLLFGIYT